MMGTKTRAQGADSQLLGAFEEVEGTLPDGAEGGVYVMLPFKSWSLGAEKPLGTDPLCGAGRDAADPYYDAVSDTGSVEIPFDLRGLGFWLKGLFGAPVTTGTGPYTHVFTAGGDVPSMALELGHAGLSTPKFERHNMVRCGEIQYQHARTGPVNGTIQLIAQGQTDSVEALDAAPLTHALTRFSQSGGSITVNGAALANVTGGSLTFSNNLEAVETIRADGKIDGIDAGEATATGSVTVRYGVDSTLPAAADAETPVAMLYKHTLPGAQGYSVAFSLPRVFLPKKKGEITGPGGIEASYDWQAAKDPDLGYLLQVTLINDVAGY